MTSQNLPMQTLTKQGVDAYCARQAIKDPNRLTHLDSTSADGIRRKQWSTQLVDHYMTPYGMSARQAAAEVEREMTKHYAVNPWDVDHSAKAAAPGENNKEEKSQHSTIWNGCSSDCRDPNRPRNICRLIVPRDQPVRYERPESRFRDGPKLGIEYHGGADGSFRGARRLPQAHNRALTIHQTPNMTVFGYTGPVSFPLCIFICV